MKALVVGYGGIAKRHIEALRKLVSPLEIGVLRRATPSKPEGIERLFTSWREAQDFRPDIALICSPTALHLDDARRVAELSVPFLIEKPVADRLEGLPEFCEDLERKKLITYVACPLRLDPLLEHVRSQLIEGGFHRPQRARIFCHSYLPSWRPERDYREAYSGRKDLGGGVGLDLIHEFDYAVWWFGVPSRVYGVRTRVSNLEISSDDQCSAVLLYPGLVVELSLSYGEKKERRGFELVYEDHSLYGDLLTGELIREEGGPRTTEKVFPRDRDQLFQRQMKHFLDCVREGKPSRNTFKDGVEILRIPLSLETVIP